jgi:hypothetical protein
MRDGLAAYHGVDRSSDFGSEVGQLVDGVLRNALGNYGIKSARPSTGPFARNPAAQQYGETSKAMHLERTWPQGEMAAWTDGGTSRGG